MGKYLTATVIPAVLILSTVHSTNSISAMRAAKCVIPNVVEHSTRAALLQQCLSRNYAQDNETVCYDELGCFPMGSPWTTMQLPFPSPLHPAEINVRLYCYTRESSERYNITLWPEVDLEGCRFNPRRKTAFIIHGFESDGNSTWVSDLKNNYLDAKDANVFLVDWGSGAELLNYLQVASNTRIVGAEVARFIKWLNEHGGLEPGDVHLMGHSLGAHICSYTAKRVPGIERITAMDAARPGFEGADQRCRLDKNDANYVEALHTDAGLLGFGFRLPVGHVDIYINGGSSQPGCHLPQVWEIKSFKDLAELPVDFINTLLTCSHGRSHEYFTQALRKDCFIWCKKATAPSLLNEVTLGYIEPITSTVLPGKCDPESCFPLGLKILNYTAKSVFAATTSDEYPFCETDLDVNSRILSEIRENSDIQSDKEAEEEDVNGVVEVVTEVEDKWKKMF